jgi:hypothetical protein
MLGLSDCRYNHVIVTVDENVEEKLSVGNIKW